VETHAGVVSREETVQAIKRWERAILLARSDPVDARLSICNLPLRGRDAADRDGGA